MVQRLGVEVSMYQKEEETLKDKLRVPSRSRTQLISCRLTIIIKH
jgi:hypothetical protein